MFHSFVRTHTYSLCLCHTQTLRLSACVCVNCAYFALIFVHFSMHIQFFPLHLSWYSFFFCFHWYILFSFGVAAVDYTRKYTHIIRNTNKKKLRTKQQQRKISWFSALSCCCVCFLSLFLVLEFDVCACVRLLLLIFFFRLQSSLTNYTVTYEGAHNLSQRTEEINRATWREREKKQQPSYTNWAAALRNERLTAKVNEFGMSELRCLCL